MENTQHGNDEQAIRRAFDRTLSVRTLGPKAKQLANLNLVRVQRASEGAPYTGLKPAGLDLGPAISAADKSITTGSIEAMEKLLTKAIHKGLREHFNAILTRKEYDKEDVAAGRLYVETYVPYIHYVEGLGKPATTTAKGHYPKPPEESH